MATYNREYRYSPTRRRKQRYALIERVIDFTNNLPLTAAATHTNTTLTKAWALDDVLQAINIKAGQWVTSVQVEVITASADSGDIIEIGYGSYPAYWGRYSLYRAGEGKYVATGWREESKAHNRPPLRFASADTIDIKIKKAALQGKIRVVVHILEDDR